MAKEVVSHYDELSKNYEEKTNKYCQERFLKIIKKDIMGKTLDIGCATGYIQKNTGKSTIGADLTLSLLKKNKLKSVCADALSLPFKNDSFETVYSVNVLEHVKSAHKMIDECKRVVKKNGKIILITPNGDMEFFLDIAEKMRLKLPEGPHKFLKYNELSELVKKEGLEIIKNERFVIVPFNLGFINLFFEKIERIFGHFCLFQVVVCKKK